MSSLVVGTAQLGMDYGIANITGRPSKEISRKMLNQAVKKGVKAIDTARAYGDSESIIGEVLATELKSKVSIITKLAPLPGIKDEIDSSVCANLVDKSVYKSMSNLRMRRLHTLLLHRGQHAVDCNGAIFDRLLFHLEKGNILALGVSVQSPEELLAALSNEAIAHIQMPFSILDWRWEESVAEIQRVKISRQMTIHIRSVYLQGLLLTRDAEFWRRANCVNTDALFHWLDDCVVEFDRSSIRELCVSYVAGLDWVDGVVIGMETCQQLEENLMLFSKPAMTDIQCDRLRASRPIVELATLNPALWQQN
jgi:aryl-alcohol dehydrogenase-like predicted oxidoreductase